MTYLLDDWVDLTNGDDIDTAVHDDWTTVDDETYPDSPHAQDWIHVRDISLSNGSASERRLCIKVFGVLALAAPARIPDPRRVRRRPMTIPALPGSPARLTLTHPSSSERRLVIREFGKLAKLHNTKCIAQPSMQVCRTERKVAPAMLPEREAARAVASEVTHCAIEQAVEAAHASKRRTARTISTSMTTTQTFTVTTSSRDTEGVARSVVEHAIQIAEQRVQRRMITELVARKTMTEALSSAQQQMTDRAVVDEVLAMCQERMQEILDRNREAVVTTTQEVFVIC